MSGDSASPPGQHLEFCGYVRSLLFFQHKDEYLDNQYLIMKRLISHGANSQQRAALRSGEISLEGQPAFYQLNATDEKPIPKLSDFYLDMHPSLADQGLAKSLDRAIGMPMFFASPAPSRSRHISSVKIAQLSQ